MTKLRIGVPDYVQERKDRLKEIIEGKEVTLAVIQVGDNPASNSYVKGKKKDCEDVGIHLNHVHFSENTDMDTIMQTIDSLNHDENCHGIIVQLPLPPHLDVKKVQLAIDPSKDVDGFHPMSKFEPCTPMGVINYLKANDYKFAGKDALVIGRSDIVGKPLARLLTDLDCTVTLAHSKSFNIGSHMKDKDLIFTATSGVEHFNFTYYWVLRNADLIIDIGLGRNEDNKLRGNLSEQLCDLLKDAEVDVISGIGGVGLLTRLQLVENTVLARGENDD